jgi:eukaryotic-like serine/threonine-protein kinase
VEFCLGRAALEATRAAAARQAVRAGRAGGLTAAKPPLGTESNAWARAVIPTRAQSMPTIGYVVAGKYELRGLLGRGSMGEVWVAHHKTLAEEVALKLLTSEPASGEVEDARAAAARFRFEAQVAARLSRKTRHIVRVTDHGDEDGLPYLVMELLEGETLEKRLLNQGPLGPLETSRIVGQVARALTEAHGAEVVHRDLKPANVFITRDEDGGLLVKLLDFGIARTIHRQRAASFATGHGLVFGTPGYMSPEQVYPLSRLDHRCDLWALATLAYEGLTGELPVTGTQTEELFRNLAAGRIVPVHERDAALPAELANFFARAFARKIDERFGSASELAHAFERAIVSERVPHRVEPSPARLGTLKGQTLNIAIPLTRRRRGLPGRSARGWIALAAPAAVLLGLLGTATAWLPGAKARTAGAMTTLSVPRPAGGLADVLAPPPSAEPLSARGEPPATTVTPPPEIVSSVPSVPPPQPPAVDTPLSLRPPVRQVSAPSTRAPTSAAAAASPVISAPSRDPDPGLARPSTLPRVAKKAANKSEVL